MSVNKSNLKGITLIEILLYLAIFVIFFFAILQFFFFLDDSNQLSGETLKIDRSIIFLSQHFEDSFNTYTSIDADPLTGSEFDDADGDFVDDILILDPGRKIYSVATGTLVFDTHDLTRSDLEVDQFKLERIEDSSDNLIGAEITVGIKSRVNSDIRKDFTNSYIFD